MNRECQQIFREIAAMKKGEDLYLKILSRIFEYKSPFGEMRREDIEPSNITEVSVPLISDETDEDFIDLRLRQLVFRYFRTFSIDPESQKNYGVLFESNGEPCSTFLVGKNGTGKSTIFDAIEYYYAHKISNAELKAIPKSKEHEYLTYGFGKVNESNRTIEVKDVRLAVKTQASNEDYELNALNAVCLPAMFCSDYDIFRIGQREDEDLRDFFFEQLGYSDLLTIRERLNSIVNEITKEINDLKAPENNEDEEVFLEPQDVEMVIHVFIDYYHKNRDLAIALCEKYINHDNGANPILEEIQKPQFRKENTSESQMLFESEWNTLQRNVCWTDKPELDSGIWELAEKLGLMYTLLNMALRCEKPTDAFALFTDQQSEAQKRVKTLVLSNQKQREVNIAKNEKLASELRTIIEDLDMTLRGLVTGFVAQYGSFIEECLGYFSNENETFRLTNEIKVSIKVNKERDVFSTTPAWYLNSFRFKLYVIALKISLAFWYMQRNRRIIPIAIDDVFNANDFDNSIHLQQFVHSIYELYNDKVCPTIPLQLILLTHDEIILSAFQKGYNINEIKGWGAPKEVQKKQRQKYNLYKNNCIVGRLLPCKDAKGMDSGQKNTPSDFYNLYHVLNKKYEDKGNESGGKKRGML